MKSSLLSNWILPLNFVLGIFTGLPFLAPVFMHFGWSTPGHWIYFFYSWMCHQLPERSFFLFGTHLTYTLAEIQQAWQVTVNPAILRQFIGNPSMGWKVAWSDRMVSMYSSLWIFGFIYWLIRGRMKPLRLWGLALFILPMALDGASHFISDLWGIGRGFRYDNLWLASITGFKFSNSFYVGEAWGSFNSLMRLLSGILFGIGVVWYTYPYLDKLFRPQDDHPLVGAVPKMTNMLDPVQNDQK